MKIGPGDGRMQSSADNYDLIASGPISGRQILLLVMGSLVLFTDGFAQSQVNVVAPAIIREWHLQKADMAPVFAANVYGLMLGSLLIAPLADIFSRRLITLACVIGFGLFSLFPPFVTAVPQLEMIRFLHGLALGAAMPCIIAAVSDYLPRPGRTQLAVVLTSAYAFGVAAVGIVAGVTLETCGWRFIFWAGGLLPLILTPLLLIALPESPAYLSARGQQEKLRGILKQMAPQFVYTATPEGQTGKRAHPLTGVAQLFTKGRASMTLLIWLVYFSTGASLYFLQQWLPILTRSAGFSEAQSAISNSYFQIGGLVGGFIIGFLTGKGGVYTFVCSYSLAAVAIAVAGLGAQSLSFLWLMAGVTGLLVVGGQNALNVFVGGTLYPSQIRSSGLGLALTFTRLGGAVLGSTFAGFIVRLNLGPQKTFATFAAPEVITALALLVLALSRRSHVPPKAAVLAAG